MLQGQFQAILKKIIMVFLVFLSELSLKMLHDLLERRTCSKLKKKKMHNILPGDKLTCFSVAGCRSCCLAIRSRAASLNLLKAASVFWWILSCMFFRSCSCRLFMSCMSSRACLSSSWYFAMVSSFC